MLAFNEMSLWLFDENFLRLGENLICREKDIIIRGKNKDRGVKVIQFILFVFLWCSHLHFVRRHHQIEEFSP